MATTEKATMMQVKKYFYPNATAADFNNDWKKCTPEDKVELQDLLGNALASGTIVLPA